MAELRATPYANPLTGLTNDAIQGLLAFMQDKRRTQQLQGLGNLLESTGIPKTVERAAYADSPRGLLDALTNVNRANVPFLKPETAEAAMTVAPFAAPVNRALMQATKGLPVGASVKNIGTKLRVKPPTDDVYEVMDATFEYAKLGGNKTLPINQLTGGVKMTDPKEVKRVKDLAEKISSPDGYVSRIIVDDLGNVLEGQHRLEALRLLGEKNVPVAVIQDLSNKYDIPAMKKALEGKFRSDETRQLLKHSIDTLEEAGSIDKALSDFAMPARYQKPFEDAIKASKVKSSYPQEEALDTAQRNAVEYPLAPAGTRYEEFGGQLTYMTPDEYLSRVRPLELDDVSLENIASLKSHVQSGGKLDPLHIYKDGKEDGRHRAYMAKELGIEKIPVALHTEANNLGQNLPMDALSLLAEQKRKEITGLLE
jgi:hypothetical protein